MQGDNRTQGDGNNAFPEDALCLSAINRIGYPSFPATSIRGGVDNGGHDVCFELGVHTNVRVPDYAVGKDSMKYFWRSHPVRWMGLKWAKAQNPRGSA